MLSEPPGEPYYIARIMEFVYKPEEKKTTDHELEELTTKRKRQSSRSKHKNAAENYMVKVNWLYRPKDLSKPVSDSRQLFLSMTSAVCPIASIRGKCDVRHRYHIKDMDEYRRTPNSFWFDKLFDLYIIRFYDAVPTELMINFPAIVCEALCARFKYAIMEPGRAKELCSTPCDCAKCKLWCSSEDSIKCATCKSSYHMACLNPPLARKPRHGFAWSCALCNRAYETRLHGEDVPTVENLIADGAIHPDEVLPASQKPKTRYEELEAYFSDHRNGKRLASLTQDQKHQLKLWPFRYLGANASIEDILDLDDRIYPRAVSRIGSRHQAATQDWAGRSIVYYENERSEKRSKKTKEIISASKPAKIITPVSEKEEEKMNALLSLPKKEKPAWLQEPPSGYIQRGGDDTVTVMWKNPTVLKPDEEGKDACDRFLEEFAQPIAQKIGLNAHTPNFVDASLKAFLDSQYSAEDATAKMDAFTKKSLKEPILNAQEVALFEEGVKKYGSELRQVTKHVKSKKPADIVRFYYMWKKTPRGHEIWDNYEGRKKNSKVKRVRAEGELIDSVADLTDDSKFSVVKAHSQGRRFRCKHCRTTESAVWQRASGVLSTDNQNPIAALCLRCAILWRRYAVVWEHPEVVLKKASKNSTKRLLEEELIQDGEAIMAERNRSKNEAPRKKAKVSKVPDTTSKPIQRKARRSNSRSSETSISSLSSLSSLSSSEELDQFLLPQKSSRKAQSQPKNPASTTPVKPDQVSTTETSGKNSSPTPKMILKIPAGKLNKSAKVGEPVATPDNISAKLESTEVSTPQTPNGNDTEDDFSKPTELVPLDELKTPSKIPANVLYCTSCGIVPISSPANADLVTLPAAWHCTDCIEAGSALESPRDCILCPATTLSFNTENNEEEYFAPDEMIKLPAGWAHLKCAIWTQSDSRPSVPNSPPQKPAACKFCTNTSGLVASCKHCRSTFHISCAERKNYKFRFNLEPARSGSSVPSFTFNNKEVTARPVVLCTDASVKRSMHLPLECDKETGKPLLSLYVDHCLTHGMKRPVAQGARRTTPTKVTLICKTPVNDVIGSMQERVPQS